MESWSQVQIFHTGDAYFSSLLQDIQVAQKSISIECYIFEMDRLTENILRELSKAQQRGVSVKLVIDGFGSYYAIPLLSRFCQQHHIELRIFHALPYPSTWLRRIPAFNKISQASWWRRMNRRNHRKITIIDEKVAYLGSMNFTEVHCEKYVGNSAWRDTGARVEGPPVFPLVRAFQVTYLRTIYTGLLALANRLRAPANMFNTAVQLNTTTRMRRYLYRHILREINHSQKRLYITTAYFLPKRSVLKALLKAAERGVDVRLLLPGKTDVPFSKWASFFLVRFLLQKKLPIYEYQKSILHAKTMIIDDQVYVGSFNLNYRSLFHDLEVIAHFKDDGSLQNMLNQWSEDLNNSKLASEKDSSSWVSRILYKIAFRLRYML
ncbi:MAG: phosphatidylserine/phosphatidylglycerophosphate/cardiolipin synthase family protein [Bdellovibrio sp.]|nr:phosphatidylserine/phosphatidylglycerophosphate/cardiolipin synthase family protein [Bdellovibrio sp.]